MSSVVLVAISSGGTDSIHGHSFLLGSKIFNFFSLKSDFADSQGKIFTFGGGANGQLGLSSLNDRCTPTLIRHALSTISADIAKALGGYSLRQSILCFFIHSHVSIQWLPRRCCSLLERTLIINLDSRTRRCGRLRH